eukprot:14373982-Heterocapsa_arctica.AAC.1
MAAGMAIRLCSIRLAAVRQILGEAIRDEASRVPEANRCLDAWLALERTQRRGGVPGPVTPCGAGQAVL